MKLSSILILVIIVASFIASFIAFPLLPEEIASHWNIRGEADSFMPRFWGAFLMPLISIGMAILFMLIPKIDPLKKNVQEFKDYFDWFIVVILIFLLYIHSLSLVWNMGFKFNIGNAIIPAIGMLFYYLGMLLSHAKRNWFIGIRTPWTLSSDEVWDKTHKLGSKLFKISGVIALLGFFSSAKMWLMLTPIIISSLFLLGYSYHIYRKLT